MTAEPTNYIDFLRAKAVLAPSCGLPCDPAAIHPILFSHQRDIACWAVEKGRAAIFAAFGMGKCHGAGTPVLMHDGSIKIVEDVRTGDALMGDDGSPRRVLSLARGTDRMYRVTLKNGDSFTCNESHILSLKVSCRFGKYHKGDIVNMSICEYLGLSLIVRANSLKHYKVSAEFGYRGVSFDPYLYGTWLGDGTCGSLSWTINDRDVEIVEKIRNFATEEGLHIRERAGRGCTGVFLSREIRGNAPHCEAFYVVKESTRSGGKRILPEYLTNTRAVRLQVLAGLIDTDGYLTEKCFEITTKWAGLRDDILFLCRSLGLSVRHGIKVVNGVEYYRVSISGNTDMVPCITRKKASARLQIKDPLVYGFTVEPIGIGEYFGFEIDGNHLYLLGDFTVTHNTLIQCEIQRQISAHVGGRHLIVAPLGVRQEFRRDAQLLGMEYCFVRRTEEVGGDGFYLTNYESIRDGKLDPDLFISVSLDEASCLRSFGSETYQAFLSLFQETPYRFVATATPSPNRYKELLHYAAFLGIMDSGQGLTRFFQRDSTKANNLTLYPHMEEEFFAFLHSWAIFLQRPSDLGYSDDGYDLPVLKVHYHEIPAPTLGGHYERDGQGQLLKDAALGLQDASREKRESIDGRIGKMMEIINSEPCEWCGGMGTIESPSCCFVTCTECKGTKMHPASNFILWHDLEAERHAIQKALPEAMAVYGTLDLDEREARIIAFSNGKTQFLSTKPEISGSGCNFQRHCHKSIFLGIGYQFNDFIQSIHRIQRFGQTHPVEIHIIYTETEREVLKTLQRKWAEHDALTARMSELIRQHGLSSTGMEASLQRKVGCDRIAVTGERYEVVNADCVEETRRMADASVQMILTSIPFGNHYEYTELFNDFGHNQDNQAFFRQMDFLSPELLRVLEPGRICAIHVKDRIQFGNVTGMGRPTVEPFHSDCIRHYIQHGFAYLGMITVVTDVVRENNQTYRLGYSEMCKDGSKMGVGSPEYVLLFCRLPSDTSKGYADRPVTKQKSEYSLARWQVDASAFWRSSGNTFLTAEELRGLPTGEMVKRFTQHSLETLYDYEEHVRIGEEMGNALPRTFSAISPGSQDPDVWHDVNRMLTLNSEQARKNLVYHICPLQIDIVARLIGRYSNPGDIIFDPFAGLGTVPATAVRMGRQGRGSELNADYFRDSLRYLRAAEAEAKAPTLFDDLFAEPTGAEAGEVAA